jgi:short-subunit dehydrogenase
MNRVLIIGATSAIAEATARLFAGRGAKLYLAARNPQKLEAIAADLKVRGAAQMETEVLDANDFPAHENLPQRAAAALGGLDVLLIAHGTLPDQAACQQSFPATLEALNINAIGVISMLTHAANYFEQQGSGSIAVISSVSGDRGRQSNYVYGAAKAAVSVFLQGLRNRLQPAGVHVLTIKPGFVDTPMTREFKKGLLWAQPETIAAGIYRALEQRRDEVYLPWFWRWIMLAIRLIPERMFKRMKL